MKNNEVTVIGNVKVQKLQAHVVGDSWIPLIKVWQIFWL